MRYHTTSKGNIPFTEEEEAEADYRESGSEKLKRDKNNKIALIISTTDTTTPENIGGILYKGGDASASAINGGVTLASLEGEIEIGVWDINKKTTIMSLPEAMKIVITLGKAYRTAMYARNDRITAVRAILIDPQGTYPTYEDAKAALDLM